MKKIHTFEKFILEKTSTQNSIVDEIQNTLEAIEKQNPFEKLDKIFKENKSMMLQVIEEFTNCKDVVYLDKILALNLDDDQMNNESSNNWKHHKDDKFKKFFKELYFILGFPGLVIIGIATVIIAFLVSILAYGIYVNSFYTPLERGVVQSVQFKPKESSAHTIYIETKNVSAGFPPSRGFSPSTWRPNSYGVRSHRNMPDSYEITVKDIYSEDTEKWVTYDSIKGKQIQRGDTLKWDDKLFSIAKTRD